MTAALNVDQTVSATPVGTGSQVTFAFTDATTGAPVTVTPTVNGVALPPSSSVTFIPGQTLQIQPPANFTHLITVTPSLQQAFTFQNTLGL